MKAEFQGTQLSYILIVTSAAIQTAKPVPNVYVVFDSYCFPPNRRA